MSAQEAGLDTGELTEEEALQEPGPGDGALGDAGGQLLLSGRWISPGQGTWLQAPQSLRFHSPIQADTRTSVHLQSELPGEEGSRPRLKSHVHPGHTIRCPGCFPFLIKVSVQAT